MRLVFTFLSICCFLIFFSCSSSAPRDELIPMIIDADTANEVDDLFALVRAMIAPEINLLGITSAQFHISPLAGDSTVKESQVINEDLVKLMDRSDLPLPLGSNKPLANLTTPQRSAASDFIVAKAQMYSPDRPLHLVILGSCTNVASAILQDTSIIPKVVVSYIGFWHDPETNHYDQKEFNSGNDTLAVDVLLNTEGLRFEVMTATTCQHLVFDKDEVLTQFGQQNKVGQYLMNRWDSYERWWTEEDPEGAHWIMWDVAIIEALIHPELAIKETFVTPPKNTKRYIKAYTSIEVEAMKKDYWSACKQSL